MNNSIGPLVERIKTELAARLPQKVPQPALIMVCGLPGTGKSYFSGKLSERTPSITIQTDMIRRTLFKPPSYSPQESYIVYSVAHSLIDYFLVNGYIVIFDATNLTESNRQKVYAIAERNKAKLLIVWIDAPAEVVRARLQARADGLFPHDLSEADWAVYEKLSQTVEPIKRNHFTVDSSVDIAPVIDCVVRDVRGQ